MVVSSLSRPEAPHEKGVTDAWWPSRRAVRRDKAAMVSVPPIGVLVWPGTGIQDNLADKARKLGISVWRFDGT